MELFHKEACPPQPEPSSPKLIDGDHVIWFSPDGEVCIVDERTGTTLRSTPSDFYNHVLARVMNIAPERHNSTKINGILGQKTYDPSNPNEIIASVELTNCDDVCFGAVICKTKIDRSKGIRVTEYNFVRSGKRISVRELSNALFIIKKLQSFSDDNDGHPLLSFFPDFSDAVNQ
jgi:hypothetical protein